MAKEPITELSLATSVAADSLFAIVTSPAAAPLTQRVAASNVNEFFKRTAAETALGITPTNLKVEAPKPRRYGAISGGTVDDLTGLQTAFNVAAEMAGLAPVLTVLVDLEGLLYGTSAKLTLDGSGIVVTNGGLKAIGAAWGVNEPIISMDEDRCRLINLVVDGDRKAPGCIRANSGNSRISRCSIFRFTSRGIDFQDVPGDTIIDTCDIAELRNTDAEFDTQSNYTGTGLYLDNADCKIFNTIVSHCKEVFRLTANASTTLVGNSHFFNGNSPGQSFALDAITQANPGVITTASAHGASIGQAVWIEGGDMTEILNTKFFVNSVPTATTMTLKNGPGIPLDTSGFTAYTSGATLFWSDFEDTKNIIAEQGSGATFTGCYIDNGEVDIFSNAISFNDTTVLLAMQKCINDYSFRMFATQANDVPTEVSFSGFTVVSDRIGNGSVPLLSFDDNGFNWDGDYTNLGTLLKNGQRTNYLSEGMLLISDHKTKTALTIFNPSAATTEGAVIELFDKGTTPTTPPFMRSAGNAMKLKGSEVDFETNGGGVLTLLDASLRPKVAGAMDLGTSGNRWAKGYINDLVQEAIATGGAGSAGVGNQHVVVRIDGVNYKLLHDN